MRYYLLFIAVTFQFISSYATNDSILFSKNGDYVLERNEHNDLINACYCDYWKLYETNKNESTYTIVFENDSVYFLHYTEPDVKTERIFTTKNKGYPCTTLASIFKVLSLAEYNSMYQFSLTSVLSTDTVVFTSKTIKTHSETYNTVDDTLDLYEDDSTLYFDINLGLTYNGKKLINDTITTNIPKIDHHYKIYYSSDNNFYFIKGWYGFSTSTILKNNPGTLTHYNAAILNRVGRRKET